MTSPVKRRTEGVGRNQMEKPEKLEIADKKRKVPWYTAEEKCRAVLLLWTERARRTRICRELGIQWRVLERWQDQAMEGMLMGLEPGGMEKGVALSPRLAVLLEKKSKEGTVMKGLDQRLARLQAKRRFSEESQDQLEEPEETGGTEKKL